MIFWMIVFMLGVVIILFEVGKLLLVVYLMLVVVFVCVFKLFEDEVKVVFDVDVLVDIIRDVFVILNFFEVNLMLVLMIVVFWGMFNLVKCRLEVMVWILLFNIRLLLLVVMLLFILCVLWLFLLVEMIILGFIVLFILWIG